MLTGVSTARRAAIVKLSKISANLRGRHLPENRLPPFYSIYLSLLMVVCKVVIELLRDKRRGKRRGRHNNPRHGYPTGFAQNPEDGTNLKHVSSGSCLSAS